MTTNSCDNTKKANIEDERKLDLALWRALKKSTTLIRKGKLINNDKTNNRVK